MNYITFLGLEFNVEVTKHRQANSSPISPRRHMTNPFPLSLRTAYSIPPALSSTPSIRAHSEQSYPATRPTSFTVGLSECSNLTHVCYLNHNLALFHIGYSRALLSAALINALSEVVDIERNRETFPGDLGRAGELCGDELSPKKPRQRYIIISTRKFFLAQPILNTYFV